MAEEHKAAGLRTLKQSTAGTTEALVQTMMQLDGIKIPSDATHLRTRRKGLVDSIDLILRKADRLTADLQEFSGESS